jgi:hypothetical protein
MLAACETVPVEQTHQWENELDEMGCLASIEEYEWMLERAPSASDLADYLRSVLNGPGAEFPR